MFKRLSWKNLYFPFRIFTLISCLFLSGTLLASFVNIDLVASWPIFVFGTIALVLVAFINFLLKNKFLALFSLGLVILIGAMAYYAHFDQGYPPCTSDGEITFTGRIVTKPEIDYKQQKLVVETEIFNATTQRNQPAKLLVTLPRFPQYHFGEKLEIAAVVEQPVVLDGFDYAGYLKGKLITGTVRNPANVSFVAANSGFGWKIAEALYDTSSYFEQALNRVIPEPQASLASGILLGIKRNISDEFMSSLQKTGLTHIIALSGFNVTIIIAIFMNLVCVYLGKKKSFWLGLLFILAFVVMTGACSSVVRAAIFSMMLIFGKTIGRRGDQTNLMLVAAVAMVLFNPFIIRSDLGFQLSFLAFAGLIYFSPIFEKIIDKFDGHRVISDFWKHSLSETLGAQLAVAPLILLQFGTVSFISPAANLLVVFIVPYAMIITFWVGIASMIYYPLGKLVALLLWPFLEYIIVIVNWLARVPMAFYQVVK